jgi:hypothetical protein
VGADKGESLVVFSIGEKNQVSVAFPEGVQMIYHGKPGKSISKSPLSFPCLGLALK